VPQEVGDVDDAKAFCLPKDSIPNNIAYVIEDWNKIKLASEISAKTKSDYINRMIDLLSMFEESIGSLNEGIVVNLIDAISKFIDDISAEPYSQNTIQLIYGCHKIGFSLKKVKKDKLSNACLDRIEILLLKMVNFLLRFIDALIGSQKDAKEILFKILKELYEYNSKSLEYYALLHTNYLSEKIQVSTKFFRRIMQNSSEDFESFKAQLLTAKNSYRCENFEEAIKIYSQCLSNPLIEEKAMIHLCISISYLHWSTSRSKSNNEKQQNLEQSESHMKCYYQLRMDTHPSEASYNYGRYHHYLGNLVQARNYYEESLKFHNMRHLKRQRQAAEWANDDHSIEASYNLSLIYHKWGALKLAQSILFAYG
jgi:hypothetical protein